jgi:transketolase N-terminal domain/subunit
MHIRRANFRRGRRAAMTTLLPRPSPESVPNDLAVLESIQRRVLWLATFMVHYANKIRENPDLIKVGGHQASSASVVSILTTLYFDFLRSGDRVAIKPHASPAFHACQYLLGALDKEYLTTLRTWHGLQAYPSRTKDPDPVDFSTGSVGLGCVAPNYAALTERYVAAHFGRPGARPRFISVLGDAELDEGSVWETVAEPVLEGVDNLIWIVDLNRQSLDRVVPGIRVERLRAMFAANGWEVIDAKYGRALEAACRRPSGELLRRRIDDLPNDEYQRLLRAPDHELAQRLADSDEALRVFAASFEPAELARVVADLGGHDLAVLRAALHTAEGAGKPAVIFAYTIKGWWLPIAGDPLNHSALLSGEEIAQLASDLGVPEGQELERFEKGSQEAELCRRSAERLGLRGAKRSRTPAAIEIPSDLEGDFPGFISTQRAFSLAISALARSHAGVADRVSPPALMSPPRPTSEAGSTGVASSPPPIGRMSSPTQAPACSSGTSGAPGSTSSWASRKTICSYCWVLWDSPRSSSPSCSSPSGLSTTRSCAGGSTRSSTGSTRARDSWSWPLPRGSPSTPRAAPIKALSLPRSVLSCPSSLTGSLPSRVKRNGCCSRLCARWRTALKAARPTCACRRGRWIRAFCQLRATTTSGSPCAPLCSQELTVSSGSRGAQSR